MANSLEKTERWASEYATTERSTWERVKHDHDRAMLVMDIEDLVDYGKAFLAVWMRHAERWHSWVSGSSDNFDQRTFERINFIEGLAVQATKGVLELIDAARGWGYAIDGEDDFRRIAGKVLRAATPPNDQVRDDSELHELKQAALREHRAGGTTGIKHWGE